MANSAWSILVGVDFDTSQIKSKLNQATKNLDIKIDTGNAVGGIKELNNSMEDAWLTFNVANEIFRTSIDLITSMATQVYELDTALTEFKKVSDLSGASLDNYVDKLSAMGSEVARTASEMVESATEFRKNGFNDEDAAQLGQIAA